MLYIHAGLLFNLFMDAACKPGFLIEACRDGSCIVRPFSVSHPVVDTAPYHVSRYTMWVMSGRVGRVVLGAVGTAGHLHVIYNFPSGISRPIDVSMSRQQTWGVFKSVLRIKLINIT